MEATKECEYKEGYLAYITEIKEPKLKRATIVNDKTTAVNDIAAGTLRYPVMTGIAVLAVLNKNSLSLFDKEHVNSLLRTFDIMHLKPMVYANNFGELQCFQLISIINKQTVMMTTPEEATYVNPD